MEKIYTKKALNNMPARDDGLLRWFLQRLTAIILLACLGVHVTVLHFTSEPINLEFVINRIEGSIFWAIFYLVFLSSTLFHGLNGLYGVIVDYAPSRNLKRLLTWLLWIIGSVSFVWGVRVLVQFFLNN